MVSEASIRDKLAHRLELIEPGLRLVEVEHYLEVSGLARGRIDILARDRFDQWVVIEIKKSSSTAREALHELHKYTGLLRLKYGLAPDRIRCLIISTHWEELLVPFSEFCRSFQYDVRGLHLMLDDSGNPVTLQPVVPLTEAWIGTVCPQHVAYLFASAQRRNCAVDEINKAFLARFGIENYCILKMDYQGGNPHVIYPYAAYLVLDQLNDVMRNRLIEELDLNREEILKISEINPYIVESEILARVYETRGPEETIEIGYPEKFLTLFPAWHVSAVIRGGRWLLMKQFEDESDLI